MKPLISTRHLSKTFYSGGQTVHAVQDVTLDINQGELFGLFGPNGAGKSTLIRMLSTLLIPTSGSATVNGLDVVRDELQVRASIGLVASDERSFYGRLTAAQNLAFHAALQNVPQALARQRIQDVLELFGLTHKADAHVQSLSTGQRQRLNMARALIHDPPILFLDEPTKSMDVQTSDFVKTLIKDGLVGQQRKTIVFISHELYEMDNFCDRVAVLADGQVKAMDTPANLGSRLPRRAVYRAVIEGDAEAIVDRWQAAPVVDAVREISRGASTSAFDIFLASETGWSIIMEAVREENGRVESYRRLDDESLRRIVEHFGAPTVPDQTT